MNDSSISFNTTYTVHPGGPLDVEHADCRGAVNVRASAAQDLSHFRN